MNINNTRKIVPDMNVKIMNSDEQDDKIPNILGVDHEREAGNLGSLRNERLTQSLHLQKKVSNNTNHTSFSEEYDEYGEVVRVGNLHFTEKTLGSGSYAEVVLAKRIPNPDDSSYRRPSLPAHFRGSFVKNIQVYRSSTKGADVDDAQAFDSLYTKSTNNKDDYVAVKIYSKSILKRVRNFSRSKTKRRMTVHTALDNVEREIALMKQMRHPNLVSLLQVIDSVDSDALYVVLEFVPLGEIMTFDSERIRFFHRHRFTPGLTKERFFKEEHAALFLLDILHGLAYLHRNLICHRDLKPENILLSEKGIAKISDFGVSHFFEEERGRLRSDSDMSSFNQDNMSISTTEYSSAVSKQRKLTRFDTESALGMDNKSGSGILKQTEGTYPFYSPEMCDKNNTFSGYASDIWAAGICLYIFASGKLPFYADSPIELMSIISKGKVSTKGLGFSKQLKDLLSKVLNKDPTKRAGLGDCLKHDFLREARFERMNVLGEKIRRSSSRMLTVDVEDKRQAFSVAQVAKAASHNVSKRLHHAKEIVTRPKIAHKLSTLSSSSWVDTAEGVTAAKSSNEKINNESLNDRKSKRRFVFRKSNTISTSQVPEDDLVSFSSQSSTRSRCIIM